MFNLEVQDALIPYPKMLLSALLLPAADLVTGLEVSSRQVSTIFRC